LDALRYLVCAPPEQRAPLPLLCFLHGHGEAAPLPLEKAMGRHGPLNARSAISAKRDFVVLAPQLPRAADIWHRYADEVRDAVAELSAQHAVDKARMYLTGFSYGGNGVFDLALAQPDLWAALWAVDPTRVPNQAPAQPLWLSAGKWRARKSSSSCVRSPSASRTNGYGPMRAKITWARRAPPMVTSAFTAGCSGMCASTPL
jgi:poly(3-hydroxybutyrate) depolymerase